MIVATALDLTKATLQDIFDYTVLALIQQGGPCATSGSCRYRSQEEGSIKRCAAGHILPDSEYAAGDRVVDLAKFGGSIENRNKLEGNTVTAIIEHGDAPSLKQWTEQATGEKFGPGLIDEPETRIDFLRAIQAAHDNAVLDYADRSDAPWVVRFRIAARKVAATFRLDPFMVGYRSGI